MASTTARLRVRQLKDLLQRSFPQAEISDLGRPTRESRVGGVLVWDGFAGRTQLQRQQMLWEALRRDLTADELLDVGFIVTVTPRESQAVWAD
ncbi:MAG: hypothetical protein FJX75_28655 [Armatimonadetes bacterium]|nr:hypothetical protein [Armatimonadota bacterium]